MDSIVCLGANSCWSSGYKPEVKMPLHTCDNAESKFADL